MSGFEVAGVLLGAFPLLISAFEHYRDVAKVANLLTNFEAEYRRSWNDAKDEELAFRLTIKRLILPLVNDEAIEGDDVEGLLADPGGPAWGSVDVGDALRARLGEAFGRYVDIMEGLQGCVLKLLDSLGVKRKRFQDKLNKMSGSSVSERSSLGNAHRPADGSEEQPDRSIEVKTRTPPRCQQGMPQIYLGLPNTADQVWTWTAVPRRASCRDPPEE